MNKLLVAAISIVLVFAVVSTATETRVHTLGMVNGIIKDDANITMYPSTINFYRNIVVGEFDGTGLYRVGGQYDFGEDKGVVGVWLDRNGMPLMGYQPDPIGDGEADNRLNLYYGRPFGDNYFGMGLHFYSDSYMRDGDDNDESEMKNMGIGLDVGMTMMEEALDWAFGFNYTSWTNVNAAGDDVTEPESNMMINLGGRYWYEFNDEVYFVPHLGFVYDLYGYTAPDVITEKWTDMMLTLGWGVNIMPSDDVLFLFDFGINYFTSKYEGEDLVADASVEMTDTDMHLPYFKVGLEGEVFDWWDVRFGAVKYWTSETEAVTEDIDDKWGFGETETFLGSGFHFGPLDVDITVNPQFALNGPYFVSGTPTALSYMASATYNLP